MSKKEALTFVFLLCLAVSCFVFGATHDPWDGTKWDVASPDIDQPHGNDYKEIYDLRRGVAIRINKEHETLATSSAGGVHKQGSARAFFQDAAPGTQVDGSAFDAGDLGCLWFDSNAAIDNQFNVLTATTPTWTPVSTEIIAVLLASNRTFAGTLTVTGESTFNNHVNLGAGDDLIGSSTSDIAFNTNKFTVAGASGNTVMAGTASVGGTLTVTGVATLGDTSALATSGAPAADAQIANKKYVDDQVDTQNMTPASYAGEESITFPNGLIMKQGTATPASAADATVTFAAAFPTAITNAWCTWREVVISNVENCGVHTMLVGSMKIRNPNTSWAGKTVNWFAIGY